MDLIRHRIQLYHECTIIPYTSYGDIYGTEREIVTKLISAINTISAYELSSTTKHWMCVYKESVHLAHVWIKLNASTHDLTENNIRT